MKLTWSALAIAFAAASAVNAHFQVLYPPVRGPFDDDNEVQFCDSYTEPANRSPFPLNDGLISWLTTHPSWTVGVLISTAASPTSFNDFHTSSGADQLVVGYYEGNGTNGLCVSVKPTAAGIPGIQNGTNVTFQMVYNGGDGILYQCMDVTLSDQVTTPSNITCSEVAGQPPSNTSSISPSPTSTKSSSGGIIPATSNGLLGLSFATILALVWG